MVSLIASCSNIDIDSDLLKRFEQRAAPLAWDYLTRRKMPLIIDAYYGSVDSPHNCLLDSDAVVCVELIEHLFPETELNLPQNIFEFIRPKIAVFTTPNADFNVLFGKSHFANGFRHEDHKFEWTQQQFKDWAHNICQRYPDYRYAILGIGELPEDCDEALGKCSQLACFVRKDILIASLNDSSNDKKAESPTRSSTEIVFPLEKIEYKLLYSKEFPFDQDSRTMAEKIMDDVKYFIYRNLSIDDPYFNEEKDICEFPVQDIFQFVHYAVEIDEMRKIIRQDGYEINEEDCVEQKLPSESESEQSDYSEQDAEETAENNTRADHQAENAEDENWD